MANGPVVTINKEFSFESYDYGFIVSHHKKGRSKTTKKKITVTSQQYFPRLDQVCNHIINTTTKKCKDAGEILTALESTKKDILKAIKKIKNIETK